MQFNSIQTKSNILNSCRLKLQPSMIGCQIPVKITRNVRGLFRETFDDQLGAIRGGYAV